MMDAGASYSRFSGVRLSNGFNVVDPPAWHHQGIGTVALNRMIEWAQRRHNGAELRPVELKRRGAQILQSDPRLAFYRRFRLNWRDADQKAEDVDWLSAPMRVSDLREAQLPANITAL